MTTVLSPRGRLQDVTKPSKMKKMEPRPRGKTNPGSPPPPYSAAGGPNSTILNGTQQNPPPKPDNQCQKSTTSQHSAHSAPFVHSLQYHEASNSRPTFAGSGYDSGSPIASRPTLVDRPYLTTLPTRDMMNELCNNFLCGRHLYGIDCHACKDVPPDLSRSSQNNERAATPLKTHPRKDGFSISQMDEPNQNSGPQVIVNLPKYSTANQVHVQPNHNHVQTPTVKLPDVPIGPQKRKAQPRRQPSKLNNTAASDLGSQTNVNLVALTSSNSERSNEKVPLLEHSLSETVDVVNLTPMKMPDRRNDRVQNKYSELYWDPQTGFWGWPPDTNAWYDTSQFSESSVGNSSGFSATQTASSQSSVDHNIPESPVEGDSFPPLPSSSRTCWDWQSGRCHRGYKCGFIHGDINYQKPPLPPSTETCRKWLRGYCQRGHTCAFMHGDIDYEPEKLLPPPPPSHALSPTHCIVTVFDHNRVKLGPGFDVQEVVTGFETPWVVMTNIPSSMTNANIADLLEPFGRVDEIKLIGKKASSSVMVIKARLSSHTEALQAVASLNGAQVFDNRITARLPVNNTQNSNAVFTDTAVRIGWEPPCKVGYGGYETRDLAYEAIALATSSGVAASIHEGLPSIGTFTVRFFGLPSDADDKYMENFARPDELMWERPKYTSLTSAIKGIHKILEDCGDLLSFDVLPPPWKDGIVRGWAQFSTPQNAKAACGQLHGRRPLFTGKTRIWARHVQSISYSIPMDKYGKIASDVSALRESVWQRAGHRVTISVIHRGPPGITLIPILVKLSGDDLKELGQLKTEFEWILRGEVLRSGGKVVWDGFFVQPAGISYLRDVELQHPGISIRKDNIRRIITLFGSPQRRESVRRVLLSKIAELAVQTVRIISLAAVPVGLFMTAGLKSLQEELGPENVTVDIQSRTLRVRGNDLAYDAAQAAIHRERQGRRRGRRSNVMECPVCFDEVTSPMTLRCGHSWCRGCLSNYLIAATSNRVFPLTCLGSEASCSEPIPIPIAREILSASDFEAVIHASFIAHIHSHPDDFHYCPTPDCPQVYRTAPQGTVLQCPSCLLRICPSCHVEHHDGFECPDRDGGDYLFNEWVKAHDVKNCPGCKVPIERAEGCNHMTCIRCQTHICWVCMATFPKGEGIYSHMRSKHGGIGLGV